MAVETELLRGCCVARKNPMNERTAEQVGFIDAIEGESAQVDWLINGESWRSSRIRLSALAHAPNTFCMSNCRRSQ